MFQNYSNDQIQKQETSLRIVNNCANPVISTQVVNEMVNVLFRKIGLTWNEITKVLEEIQKSFTIEIVDFTVIHSACKLAECYLYSYFDSLILASALQADAIMLFTEDLQNGQIIEHTLKIINPYL